MKERKSGWEKTNKNAYAEQNTRGPKIKSSPVAFIQCKNIWPRKENVSSISLFEKKFWETSSGRTNQKESRNRNRRQHEQGNKTKNARRCVWPMHLAHRFILQVDMLVTQFPRSQIWRLKRTFFSGDRSQHAKQVHLTKQVKCEDQFQCLSAYQPYQPLKKTLHQPMPHLPLAVPAMRFITALELKLFLLEIFRKR